MPTTQQPELRDGSLGRIRLSTIPLPDGVLAPTATYTPSGAVFVLYRTADAPETDWFHAAIVAGDGTGFREIFSGRIPESPTANGIRHMPFSDNRRMLLGDYVLEATPDLDTATSVELVGVEYPWGLTSDPLTSHHWSEIIVSPDEHIAWTILRTDMSAIVALGRLRRGPEGYAIDEPAIISTSERLTPDPQREGHFLAQPMLGGEVKQFVRGGAAISAVGDGGAALTDSVIQSLTAERLEAVTRTPGYDETTILSPDERLGIVMTARASHRTDPRFLGLVPRPHASLVTIDLAWVLYQYAVDGVRRFRPGNIGPVLIDIERSTTEPGYQGVPLNSDDDSWVYVSPMSWHPGGTRAMWMEMRRGSGGDTGPDLRIRVAELLDHTPAAATAPVATPDRPPYGIVGTAAEEVLRRRARVVPSGRIAGAHSGYVEFERSSDGRGTWSASATYVGFSDDGTDVLNGYERSGGSMSTGAVYEAELQLDGGTSGEMHLRATWSGLGEGTRLLFGRSEDGRPQSFGFARFGDDVARVDELVE